MMKSGKKRFLICAVLVGVGFALADGSYFVGPNFNLKFSWKTGFNLFNGKYITGTLEGYGNEKQVYARYGAGAGTYSDWVSANDLKAEATDYGAITSGDYEAIPYWR